jgi:hypothetical protein
MGRAIGGMADTIRRRMIRPDDTLDDRLEPAIHAARRAQLRRLVRIGWTSSEMRVRLIGFLAKQLLVMPTEIERVLALPYFGEAWAELELRSASLARRKVPVVDLENQTEQATALVDACTRARKNEAASRRSPAYIAGSVAPAERQL